MSVLPLANNAEGGTDGVTVTDANSGGASGDAFDYVYIGSHATLAFDDDGGESDGVMSYRFGQTGAAPNVLDDQNGLYWIFDSPYEALTLSACVQAPHPTQPVMIMAVFTGGGSDGAQVLINTDGTLSLGNSHLGAVVAATSVTTISNSAMTRLDLQFTANTSMTLSIYSTDPHGVNADEVITSTDVGTAGDGTADAVLFGLLNWYNGFAGVAGPFWMDELRAYIPGGTFGALSLLARRILCEALPYFISAGMLGSPIIQDQFDEFLEMLEDLP